MTGRHHFKLLILVTLGILLLSVIGLIACSQAAPATPATPAPPPTPATPATPAPVTVPLLPNEGQTTPPPASAMPQIVTAQVSLAGFAFSPDAVIVSVGATVTWTNKDSVTHTVTSNGGLFDSGNLAQGKTFSYTFKEKGTFQYHCNLHPSMTGKIIVVEGNAAPSTSGTTTTPATGGTTPSGGSSSSPDYNY